MKRTQKSSTSREPHSSDVPFSSNIFLPAPIHSRRSRSFFLVDVLDPSPTPGHATMDPTFDNLPYQIPGPAGGPSYATPSQARNAPAAKSEAARRFRQPAWQVLLSQIFAPPYGNNSLTSSIALLRANALSHRFTRLPRIPILLGSLSWVGRDASVTLLDPTGTIRATIHAAVFEEHRTGIEPGSAMLLDGVAAVCHAERRPSGFKVDQDEGLHVSVQPCHVKAVIPVGADMPASPLRHASDPKDSYNTAVLSPPIVRRPSTRLARRPQPTRAPLRPRAEPANIQRNRRPDYGRGQYASRGASGFKGRPYGQRRSPPGGMQRSPGAGHAVKRPYTNVVPPLPAVRRHGMQPLPKRPAPNQRGVDHFQQPVMLPRNSGPRGAPSVNSSAPATSNCTGLNSLTEDQLDSLLGDFDVDAVIAASGKSQSVSTVSSAAKKSTNLPESHRLGTVTISQVGEVGARAEQPEKACETVVSGKASESVLPGKRCESLVSEKVHVVPKDTPLLETDIPHQSAPTPAQLQANRVGQQALSGVDEAMIDNLLEGLDDSDFR